MAKRRETVVFFKVGVGIMKNEISFPFNGRQLTRYLLIIFRQL